MRCQSAGLIRRPKDCQLADDPAIKHIMEVNRLSVGLLSEIPPQEDPAFLGVNENAGEVIRLRLRTNQHSGFMTYRSIRFALCHELTHNIWGDHNNEVCSVPSTGGRLADVQSTQFKQLNHKLNCEIKEFEQSVYNGAHTLGGSGPVPAPDETPERRRQLLVQVVMGRRLEEGPGVEDSGGGTAPAGRTH